MAQDYRTELYIFCLIKVISNIRKILVNLCENTVNFFFGAIATKNSHWWQFCTQSVCTKNFFKCIKLSKNIEKIITIIIISTMSCKKLMFYVTEIVIFFLLSFNHITEVKFRASLLWSLLLQIYNSNWSIKEWFKIIY